MNEMRERVARAMSYWSGNDPDCLVYPIKQLPVTHDGYPMMRADTELVPHWKTQLALARIAMSAMREPTDAMLKCCENAGWHGNIDGLPECEREQGRALWQKMVDAADTP